MTLLIDLLFARNVCLTLAKNRIRGERCSTKDEYQANFGLVDTKRSPLNG